MIWRRIKKSTREQEEQFNKMMSEADLSWKDTLAMLISAFLTIVLPCALILTAFGALMYFLFA